MIDSEIVMLFVYFGSILLLMLERVCQLIFEWWMEIRHQRRECRNTANTNEWDWLIELENQPIEVTFDHETFLVFDRDTGHWNLEKREPEPPDDFIDSLFGDDEVVLIQTTSMFNGYVRRKTGLGIKSPSGGWDYEEFNRF